MAYGDKAKEEQKLINEWREDVGNIDDTDGLKFMPFRRWMKEKRKKGKK